MTETQQDNFYRIPFNDLRNSLQTILIKHGFSFERAQLCAEVFAENSLDGIYTHGTNRFPRFIKYIQEKCIDVDGSPELVHSFGAIEQWNGNLGPGPLNAIFASNRATEIASKFGIGCVALANTNHWMRGGSYGWHAAKMGFVFIAWTNTLGLMPAWGAKDARLGNNPIVFALPYNDEAIVLDMAMSQFSYGKIETLDLRNELLPFNGGYNSDGILTSVPSEILESKRILPAGYWKGTGLALLLDILAAILSGGLPTVEISKEKYEHGLSQVFIAFDISKLSNYNSISQTVNSIIDDFHKSIPVSEKEKILYPGERVLRTRNYNLEHGIPVDKIVWQEIISLQNNL